MEEIPQLDKKGLRKFGITTGIAIAVLFGLLLPWLFDFGRPVWPWVLAGVMALWALVNAESMRGFYTGWMRVALAISKVTTPIVLAIAFFLVFFPVALIFRILGKDPMERRFEASTDSYRHESDPIPPESMEKPF
jgi:hypothetical protein